MKKALALIVLAMIFAGLSYASIVYLKSNKNVLSRHDFFILAKHDGADVIGSLRSTITPLINTIIRQELNLPESDQNPIFRTPPHCNLTLYYIFDWLTAKDSSLNQIIDNAFKQDLIPAFEVELSSPAFFGINNDEIVMKIDDQGGSLSKINTMIKKAFLDSHQLYNVKKSEHFAYVPHIALGRLPVNDKRYFLSDDGLKKLNKIKQRIEHEVFPVIKQVLDFHNKKIHVNSFCVYDVGHKIELRNYFLK